MSTKAPDALSAGGFSLEGRMGCNCGKRRDLTAQAINNIRRGELAAAKQNAQRFVQTVRIDARNLSRNVRSVLTMRPAR